MKIASNLTIKKKILIIGASGFIGNSIYKSLSKSQLFSVSSLSLEQIDLTNSKKTNSLNSVLQQSHIVIMAAAVTRDRGNTIENMLKNISMTSNLSNLVTERSISHLIYISTVDVYGRKALILPLNETSRIQPSDYYAISKLTSELILKQTCFDNQIQFSILRLPGIYGPGDSHNSPIRVFIDSIFRGKRINIAGDGTQLRDFVYINDVGEIVKNICINNIKGTYNIVSGKSYSINKIIDMISCILKKTPIKSYSTNNKNKLDLVFNESLLKNLIPSFSFTDLETGIRRTCDYYCDK